MASKQFADIKAEGVNFDFGAVLKRKAYELSLQVKNAIPESVVVYSRLDDVSYRGEEVLPRQWLVSYKQKLGVADLLSQMKLDRGHALLALGAIYRLPFLSGLQFSGGYREFLVLKNVKQTVSVGAGLDLGEMGFYYAYEKSDHVEYDHKHYFSCNVRLQ